MHFTEVIKYPILTEKSYAAMAEQVYTFAVAKKAHKIEIKRAVEFIFQVRVTDIRTANLKPKRKRVGRFVGYTSAYKKAIVKLNKEDTINFFPNETAQEPKKAKVEKLSDSQEASAIEKRVAEKLAKKASLKKSSSQENEANILAKDEAKAKALAKDQKASKAVSTKAKKTAKAASAKDKKD